MDVPSHELLECVKKKSELKVGIIILVVRLKDLHVEENDTGQEGLIAHLVKGVNWKAKEETFFS